jgi:hypothetical protein
MKVKIVSATELNQRTRMVDNRAHLVQAEHDVVLIEQEDGTAVQGPFDNEAAAREWIANRNELIRSLSAEERGARGIGEELEI